MTSDTAATATSAPVTPTATPAVTVFSMPGLYLKKEYKRVYPHEGLASNIVGFVGIDNDGLAGIEYSLDDVLALLEEFQSLP